MAQSEDNGLIEKVSRAIYDVQVRAARETINELTFDASELVDLAQKLRPESQTAQILIFYSYLDDRIENLVKLYLWHLDSNKADDALFGMMGPLSTFSSRVPITYHLGWLRPEQKAKLDAFRKLRNEFAHRAFKVSITDDSMKALVDKLGGNLNAFLARMTETGPPDLKCIDELLCKLVLLAKNTFTDLLVLPAAIRFQVSPADIAPSFDEQPELLKNIAREASRALLASGAVSPGPEGDAASS